MVNTMTDDLYELPVRATAATLWEALKEGESHLPPPLRVMGYSFDYTPGSPALIDTPDGTCIGYVVTWDNKKRARIVVRHSL
ncbi:hypothetical protein GCM10023226_41130 [Nocardioides nanhaiensis]|uniref:SRPBCC family protein n=1 Tax=Nocardioides nanhaiensis TaxID=1476871 RepID=A0ABP8X1W4_9ACTN